MKEMSTRDRDLERLIPIQAKSHQNSNTSTGDSNSSSPSVSPVAPSHHAASKEAIGKVIRSWAWKKFISGCVILLPIAITFCVTWWFISFVDGFFSPIYAHFGINIFGLGFVTSITFIFLIGVFMSSWLGASLLGLGEWFIKKMPLISYIYAASKQISAAISPDQNSKAFKEVAIIKHPRNGEYAFGFITSVVILRRSTGSEELCCVYVPTNHLYLGDIFLISSKDILRPNLSVREGLGEYSTSIRETDKSLCQYAVYFTFCLLLQRRNSNIRRHVNTSNTDNVGCTNYPCIRTRKISRHINIVDLGSKNISSIDQVTHQLTLTKLLGIE